MTFLVGYGERVSIVFFGIGPINNIRHFLAIPSLYGLTINDVTQFWITFDPPLPISMLFYVLICTKSFSFMDRQTFMHFEYNGVTHINF